MATTLKIEAGQPADVTVKLIDNCVLIFGFIPMSQFGRLTKLAPKKAIMSPGLARMAGANLAFGLSEDVDALKKKMEPESLLRTATQMMGKGLSERAIEWLAIGERGMSSEAMFYRITKADPTGDESTEHPHDPDDLRRCLLLCDWCHFDYRLMEDVSLEWRCLVKHWLAIRTCFESEAPDWKDPGAKWNAPKTYALMQQALNEAKNPPVLP